MEKEVVDKKPLFTKKDLIFTLTMSTIVITMAYVTQNCMDFSWQPGDPLFQFKWK